MIVAGVDFGTLSVRVSIVDRRRGGWDRAWPSTRSTGRRATRTTRRRATTTRWTRWRSPRGARSRRRAWTASAIAALAIDTTGSSVVPVGEGLVPLDDYYLWCDHRARREAARDHAQGARDRPRGDPLVRRHLLVGVGILEAAALAAPQPRQARPLRHRVRALRHGGGHALRHHRPRAGAAQRLRDGPQVDVERGARRPAAGELPHRGRSAARRRAGQARRDATRPPTRSPAA